MCWRRLKPAPTFYLSSQTAGAKSLPTLLLHPPFTLAIGGKTTYYVLKAEAKSALHHLYQGASGKIMLVAAGFTVKNFWTLA
jgi:hypothetical protein